MQSTIPFQKTQLVKIVLQHNTQSLKQRLMVHQQRCRKELEEAGSLLQDWDSNWCVSMNEKKNHIGPPDEELKLKMSERELVFP